MTESSKPAARTRKPAARKTTPRKPAAPKPAPVYTQEQKQAKLEAYHTLKQAGLEVPKDLKDEVEGWVSQIQQAQTQAIASHEEAQADAIARANIEGPWYIRNLNHMAFNLRLDSQTEKRRIELKGRGTPGDMHPIKEEDLNDSVLITNLRLGLIEVIPAGEAQLVIEKQTHNMTRRVHTPLSVLAEGRRDAWGRPDPGEVPVKVAAEFNQQGVTVATIDQRIQSGQMHDRQIGNDGGLQRQEIHSGFVPTGGNPAIISQGGMMTEEARLRAADDIARRKDIQGPVAGLGPVTVTVAPVQRT